MPEELVLHQHCCENIRSGGLRNYIQHTSNTFTTSYSCFRLSNLRSSECNKLTHRKS